MYGLEILNQCGKRVETKSQKVFGANSYACRSYSGKTGHLTTQLPFSNITKTGYPMKIPT